MCILQAVSTGDGSGGGGRQAYVTLLYGEAFMLGVRVLGQSLRETGTTRYISRESISWYLSAQVAELLF